MNTPTKIETLDENGQPTGQAIFNRPGRPKGTRQNPNLELDALASCCRLLAHLSEPSRQRVVECLHKNYVAHDVTPIGELPL